MCRMLGITGYDFNKHKEILNDFFRLALNGNVPPKNKPGHLEGWGIGYYSEGKAKIIKSGGSVVEEQKRFFSALKRIGRSRTLIVHFRKSAWDKTTDKRHSHPFLFKKYIFAHNGTIFDYKELLNFIPGKYLPDVSALDTEVFFRYLLNGFPKSFKTSIKMVEDKREFSALNFLLCGGQKLYAYREYSKWPDYYTLFKARHNTSRVVCSEQLDSVKSWEEINNRELAVL